jgi:hypothetical protein
MCVNLRIFTTEYCYSALPNSLEFYGGNTKNRLKTPCSSVTSVVIFFKS